MTRYGYIKLDKKDPDVARQASLLDTIGGFDKLFVEQKKSKELPNLIPEQLTKVMQLLQNGDLLYVASFDRFCTQTREFIERVEWILSQDADFISLEEVFDTRSSTSKSVFKTIKALETLDRETMSLRKKEGIRIAREDGRRIGRPPVSIPVGFRDICKDWELGKITGVEAIRKSKMKSTSFYKKADELGYRRNK